MLLLLDHHFSPAVSRPLRGSGVDVWTLGEWLGGEHQHSPDGLVLTAAFSEGRTLVTYDVNTIPALLTAWNADGRSHSGVVFVNTRTIRQNDHGGLIRALRALIAMRGGENWHNQVGYLTPA